MALRRSPLLAAALVLAVTIGGCGSSSTSSSTASTATAPTTSTTSTSAPALSGTAAAEAVEACKKEIAAQTTLPATAKAKLEAVCEKASKGDTAAVKKVAEEVCEEAINTSGLPAGTEREQALAACKGK